MNEEIKIKDMKALTETLEDIIRRSDEHTLFSGKADTYRECLRTLIKFIKETK